MGRIPVPEWALSTSCPCRSTRPRRSDCLVEFVLRLPVEAAHGDRLDWPQLCHYGQRSATLYRAYLGAVAFMGRSARNGQPITERIAAPVLGPDGKQLRGKGGRIRRDPTQTIPNPAARYVRELSEGDYLYQFDRIQNNAEVFDLSKVAISADSMPLDPSSARVGTLDLTGSVRQPGRRRLPAGGRPCTGLGGHFFRRPEDRRGLSGAASRYGEARSRRKLSRLRSCHLGGGRINRNADPCVPNLPL